MHKYDGINESKEDTTMTKNKATGVKKKVLITAGGLALATVFGLGIYQSDASQQDPKLSTEDVKQLVADQYPGVITELELEKDFNKVVYEVEVENDGMEYELKLDGNTGEVLKLKEKDLKITEKNTEDHLAGSRETDDDDDHQEQAKKTNDDVKKDTSTTNNKEEVKAPTTNEKKPSTVIDINEAVNIALNEFKGTVTDVELDEDDGRLIYEIEMKSGEEEAEIEIDAYTGAILVIEIDD